MTHAEMNQLMLMNRFFDKLCNLSDSDLMTRKTIEMEKGRSLKNIYSELNRRICEQ